MAERQQKPKAVVLLSGGVDSATVMAIARRDGFAPHALSFDYGQRHAIELKSAKRVAAAFGAEHSMISFDLRQFGGSALTSDVPVPKDRPEAQMASGIPVTYVPARNTIFLSFALGLAEVIGAQMRWITVAILTAARNLSTHFRNSQMSLPRWA